MHTGGTTLSLPHDDYVQHIVGIHLSPQTGSPYWLERDQRLSAQALRRVRNFADFKQYIGFRTMDEQRRFEHDTRFRPIETFIPASGLQNGRWIWVSQTGGTTGSPKHGCWDSFYWEKVLTFSDEFLDFQGVPRNVNWLFMGPTGPHTTGRLVISIAEYRGGRCFSIDLDPRIVKIFGTEGMLAAYERYIRHIWDQAKSILRYQRIQVLFCTSRLLEMLPEQTDLEGLRSLRAIVHAGTTMSRDSNLLLREEVFPGIPIVGIYGTSTTGVSYQKPWEAEDDYRVVYIPASPFIVLEVVDDEGRLVDYGQEGNVATYRLTEDFLIPGFWERDRAIRTRPYGAMAGRFSWDWVAEIYSPEFALGGKVEGVY